MGALQVGWVETRRRLTGWGRDNGRRLSLVSVAVVPNNGHVHCQDLEERYEASTYQGNCYFAALHVVAPSTDWGRLVAAGKVVLKGALSDQRMIVETVRLMHEIPGVRTVESRIGHLAFAREDEEHRRF